MTARPPILMRPDEIWSIKQAADHARRDDKTIRRWIKQDGIGRQAGPGSPIQVSRVALEMRLAGDDNALEKLRRGDRTDPDVLRYYDFVGIDP